MSEFLFQDSFDSRHSTGAVRPSGLSPDSGIFEMIGSEFSGVITDFPEPDTVPRMQNDFRLPGPFTGEFTKNINSLRKKLRPSLLFKI